jgi:hypothetical protein
MVPCVVGSAGDSDLARGHKDLATAQRYMHLSPPAVEDAIRLIDRGQLSHASPVVAGDILETPVAR